MCYRLITEKQKYEDELIAHQNISSKVIKWQIQF